MKNYKKYLLPQLLTLMNPVKKTQKHLILDLINNRRQNSKDPKNKKIEKMGSSILQKPSKDKNYEYEYHPELQFGVCCMKGWRPFMQDAHIAIYPIEGQKDVGVFAVFDGHGGMVYDDIGPDVALYAKKYFMKCLMGSISFTKKDYQNALVSAFVTLDQMMLTAQGKQQLLQIRKQNAQLKNATLYESDTIAGCTALAILLTKQKIYCANAGDSKAVVSIKTQEGKANGFKQLNFEHKPWRTAQKIRIQQAGGKVNSQGRINGNLNLSRALGDFQFKSNPSLIPSKQMVISLPDVVVMQRKHAEFIILGCDGIWETKSSEQMIKWIKKKRNSPKNTHLTKILASLLDDELAGGFGNDIAGVDNMSAMLVWFNK